MTALERYGAELVPVGESWCLFQAATRATALLNGEAATLIPDALSGPPLTPLARQLRSELDASGFAFDERNSAGPNVARSRDLRLKAAAPFEDEGSVWRQTYKLASGGRASLSSNDLGLADLLRATLAPLATNAATRIGQSHTAKLVARRTGDSFAVWRDGLRVAASLTLGEARRSAIEALILALLPPGRVAAILHASGVVTSDGHAVLLAGVTGAGKTTLTMGLIARGAQLLGDDLMPLADTGKAIAAFPAAASIKSGSWPIVGAAFPELDQQPIFRLGPREVRYLPLVDRSCPAGEWHRPSLLVFPKFERRRALAVTPLSPEEALARLLESGTAIVGWPRSIAPLVRLVEKVPAIDLAYGDLEAAARGINSAAEMRA